MKTPYLDQRIDDLLEHIDYVSVVSGGSCPNTRAELKECEAIKEKLNHQSRSAAVDSVTQTICNGKIEYGFCSKCGIKSEFTSAWCIRLIELKSK